MTVTKDATSDWYVPANATEWTELLAGTGIGNPTNLWLCQEASGTLADSIGSISLNTATGTLTYATALTGWTRKALQFASNSNITASVARGSAVAFTILQLAKYSAGASTVYSTDNLCGTSNLGVQGIDANGFLRDQSGGSGSSDQTAVVRPFINSSGSSVEFRTDGDQAGPTAGTSAWGTTTGFGQFQASGITSQTAYAAAWIGTALSDSQITTLISRIKTGPPPSSDDPFGRPRRMLSPAITPKIRGLRTPFDESVQLLRVDDPRSNSARLMAYPPIRGQRRQLDESVEILAVDDTFAARPHLTSPAIRGLRAPRGIEDNPQITVEDPSSNRARVTAPAIRGQRRQLDESVQVLSVDDPSSARARLTTPAIRGLRRQIDESVEILSIDEVSPSRLHLVSSPTLRGARSSIDESVVPVAATLAADDNAPRVVQLRPLPIRGQRLQLDESVRIIQVDEPSSARTRLTVPAIRGLRWQVDESVQALPIDDPFSARARIVAPVMRGLRRQIDEILGVLPVDDAFAARARLTVPAIRGIRLQIEELIVTLAVDPRSNRARIFASALRSQARPIDELIAIAIVLATPPPPTVTPGSVRDRIIAVIGALS